MGVRACLWRRCRSGGTGDGGGAGRRRQRGLPRHRAANPAPADDTRGGDGAVIRPTTLEEAARVDGEYRAGGTDLLARRRLGLHSGVVLDLTRIPGLVGVEQLDEGVRIGALTRIADVATAPIIAGSYPALASTAASLATPQIRAAGTVGGNLLQRNRCPYYRHPHFSCFK